MNSSAPIRNSATRLGAIGLVMLAMLVILFMGLLIACTQKQQAAPGPPLAPPLPADMAGFDSEIVEQIRSAVGRLERDPSSPESWRRLGVLYHAHDQIDLAAQCYRQSLALAPLAQLAQLTQPAPLAQNATARTHFYLALAEERSGNLDEAIAAMRRTIDLDASYTPARWRLGLWLLESDEVTAALETLQDALHRAGDDPSVHHALGRAHLQAGADHEAALLLESWLAEHPDDRYGRFLLGTAYRRLGRAEEAEQELALGQGVRPSWTDPWSEEIEARRTGFPARLEAATSLLDANPRQAVVDLELLHRARPDNPTVLINLGIGYRRLQRLEESAGALTEAVRLEPARGLAHFHLALTRSAAASLAETPEVASDLVARALEHAERAVELQPTSAKSHAMYGELLARAGRTEAAVASFTRALEDPQDPAWLHRLGGLLCELGRWTEAVPVLESFVARVGTDAGGLFLLGVAQANSGNVAAARKTLELALGANPGDARIQSALAQLGDFEP